MPMFDFTPAGALVQAVQLASQKDRQKARDDATHVTAQTRRTSTRAKRKQVRVWEQAFETGAILSFMTVNRSG